MAIRSTARVYTIMLAALAMSLSLRWLLDPWLGDYLPLVTIYGVVALAVWIGGYRVAALAAILGYLACDYWFMEPRGQFGFTSTHNFIRFLTYLTGCSIIIGFGEAMRAVLRRAESRGVQLEQEVLQRQKAEEMLRRRNKDMEQLLEALPVAVWVAHDPECHTVTGNLAAERLHGVQQGTNISATLPREERHWVRHSRNGQEMSTAELPLQQTIATGNSLENLEFEMELPDGRIITLLCNTVPLRDDEGHVRGAVAACQDISTLKAAERQMRESEERFAKAFSASPLSLTISSLKTGKLIEVNETFVNVTGYAREEAIGRTTVELGVWANLQDRQAEMDTVRQVGGIRNTEYVFRRRNGEEIVGLLSAERIDISGEPYALTVIQDITERKQTEERYRGLFTSMQEGLLVAEMVEDGSNGPIDFRYLDMNPAAEQILRISREQVVGKTAREILPNVREDLLQIFAEVARTGERVRFEVFEPLVNQHHQSFGFRPAPGQVAVLFWDITEHKQAEEALRESEERFRLAADAVNGIIYDYDLINAMTKRSRGLFEVLGYHPEEVPSTTEWWRAQIHPGDLQSCDEQYQQQAAVGDTVLTRYRVRHRDGRWLHVEDRAVIKRDEAGKPVRLVGCTMDVTERWLAEQRLAAVLSSIDDHLVCYDEQWRYTYVNDAAARSLGKSRDELLGHCIWDLFPNAMGNQYYRDLHESVREQQVIRSEHYYAPFDRWFDNHIYPSADGVTVFAADITERKRAEEALAETASSLTRERERLAIALRAGQMGAYEWRIGAPAVWWSPEIYSVYGVEPGAFTPTLENFSTLVHPDDREELWRKTEECIARREVFTHEYRIIWPDGEVRWVANRSQVGLDAAGQVEHITGVALDITERKRAEQALRESEERFAKAFNASPHLVSISTLAEGRYIDVNESVLRSLGYTREEMIGRLSSELQIFPEGRDKLINAFRERGSVRDMEIQIRAKDGKLSTLLLSAEIITIKGEPCILTTSNDITERKRVEEALRVSEERFRLATSAGSVGVWDWDIVSNTISWSDSIYEIHGLQPGEFDGTVEAFAKLVHPDDRALVNEDIQRALQDGAPYKLEFRAIRPDSSIIWISTQARVIRDASGKPLRLLGGSVDITQRKQAELALRQSEERFRLASDAGAALVYDIDLTDGRKIIVHGLESVTGYQSDEVDLISEWWHSLIHPDDLPAHLEIVDQHIRTGGRYRSVYRIRQKTGAWIWAEDTAQVIQNASGVSIQLVGAIVDITAQQQAMAEEKRLREVAEAHNRAKDEFLTVVSHELRSPLNAILGYARLTRTTPNDTAAVVRNCEVIERNARAQQQLIEDLLDTARIISGKLKLELALADLRLVLEEAVEVVRPAAEVKRIHLSTQLDQAPQSLLCDAARLRQVSWNLLQNAIKFTPEGGHVEFRVERDDSFVRLIVSDTGHGIEPDFLPAVFDRFSQSDMSSTRRHGGLGLGLALVKQLVELHGGKIEAASAGLGQGATFTVTLPLHIPQATSYQPPHVITEPAAKLGPMDGLPRLEGTRVLVVDDQEEARALVAQVLRDWGARVTVAASGREALTLIEKMAFDVMVCDIAMPEMNGYEVVASLRTMEQARGLSHEQRMPAVALTALARAEDRVQALAANFQLYVAKPVDLAELIVIVHSLTQNRQQGAVFN